MRFGLILKIVVKVVMVAPKSNLVLKIHTVISDLATNFSKIGLV